MNDLISWLRTQLDTDAEIVETMRVGGYEHDTWVVQPSRSARWSHVVALSRTLIEPPEAAAREDDQPVAIVQSGRWEDRHIANNDPARVARQVQAHRAILDDYDRALERRRQHPGDVASAADLLSMVRTIKRLASIYSDRDGYKEEWSA